MFVYRYIVYQQAACLEQNEKSEKLFAEIIILFCAVLTKLEFALDEIIVSVYYVDNRLLPHG